MEKEEEEEEEEELEQLMPRTRHQRLSAELLERHCQGLADPSSSPPQTMQKKPAARTPPSSLQTGPAAQTPSPQTRPAAQTPPSSPQTRPAAQTPPAAAGRKGKPPKQTHRMKKKPAADANTPKRRRITGKKPHGLPMSLGHSEPSMGWISMANRAGFNSAQARLWQLLQLPTVLMMMCVIANAVEAPSVLCVKYFAGVGAIAQGFVDAGFAALTYDKFHLGPADEDAQQDLNDRSGWMTALCWIMNLDPGGLCWLGTVCSSWVVVSRGSTGRSPAFVLGDQRHPSVQQANAMATRSALLCMICYVRGIAFILEQPSSSLMLDLPAWRWIERVAGRVQGWGF